MNSPKNYTSTLGEKVAQARIAEGFSISDAAKSLGFKNYQTLSEIEKGERKLNANELSATSKLYKKNLDFFFESETPVITLPLWRKAVASAAPMEDFQSEFLFFLENYSNM
ncbi:MAG: helix-turn-helix transcriptional regulator, partial [Deltaproteobacteria bacterium]|nr:helix-turn-helix transcriptional regulator [Deltaproteobacteria bacterium]